MWSIRDTDSTGPGSTGLTGVTGLGTARAVAEWRWASSQVVRRVPEVSARVETATRAPSSRPIAPPSVRSAPARSVRLPQALLGRMAQAAAETGRDESELWAEAARDWLERYEAEREPQPPPPAAAALALPRRARCWSAIDRTLDELRQATSASPTRPAA